MPLSDRIALDDFCALQESRLRRTLERRTLQALARKKAVRKAHHQALCDYDLVQQPFRFASALGPRARNLSQLDRDEP